MLIDIGKIVAVSLGSNRGSSENRLMADVEMSGSDDIKSVEIWATAGSSGNPPIGSRVLVVEVSKSYLVGICADDGIEPVAASGDRVLYGSSGGAITSKVAALANGDVVINDGADWAVQFTAMKSAFDQLAGDLNTLTNAFLSHTHLTAGTGSPSVPTITPPVPAVTTADMSGSKVETVKLP